MCTLSHTCTHTHIYGISFVCPLGTFQSFHTWLYLWHITTLTNYLFLEILCFFHIQNTMLSIFSLPLSALLLSFSFVFLNIFIVTGNRDSVIQALATGEALNIWESIREAGKNGNLSNQGGNSGLIDPHTERCRTLEGRVCGSSFYGSSIYKAGTSVSESFGVSSNFSHDHSFKNRLSF